MVLSGAVAEVALMKRIAMKSVFVVVAALCFISRAGAAESQRTSPATQIVRLDPRFDLTPCESVEDIG